MNIYSKLKNKIKLCSRDQIVKELEYNSPQRGLQTLDSFLKSKDVYTWLHSGNYDFKYTADQFLKKICILMNVSKDILDHEIKNQSKYYNELTRIKDNYIFVNTNFKRNSEPLFMLACSESKRRIRLNTKEYTFLSDSEVINLVSNIVKQHYIENDGKLFVWGCIDTYIYHHNNKIFTFDIDGTKIVNSIVSEAKASIKLNGKIIC